MTLLILYHVNLPPSKIIILLLLMTHINPQTLYPVGKGWIKFQNCDIPAMNFKYVMKIPVSDKFRRIF